MKSSLAIQRKTLEFSKNLIFYLDAVENAINKASRIFAKNLIMLKLRVNKMNIPGKTKHPIETNNQIYKIYIIMGL
jgi:hypothetical protein